MVILRRADLEVESLEEVTLNTIKRLIQKLLKFR